MTAEQCTPWFENQPYASLWAAGDATALGAVGDAYEDHSAPAELVALARAAASSHRVGRVSFEVQPSRQTPGYWLLFKRVGGYRLRVAGPRGLPDLAPHFACVLAEATKKAAKADERQAARVAARKTAAAAFINPAKIGDVYYSSGGYDQTNVDFAVVTSVTPRGVKLAMVGKHREPVGFMAERVTPDLADVTGEPKQFNFDPRDPDHLPGGRWGCWWKWDGKPKSETHYG